MPTSQAPVSNATNTNKRKKTSGLTGLELRMAYQSLISVKSLLKTTNEVDASGDLQLQENLITFEPDFEETLAKMLEMMKSKLDGPQVRCIPLANMTFLIVSYRPFFSLA
jgi:hypothetical protein